MTWRRLPLCFELLSPLHIGFLPNQPGTVVARTRCYVPGKNLWGAVTASLTPRLHPHPTAGNYRDVGELLRQQIVFSYFYLSDGAQLFTPDYTENGLVWGNLTDRAFRARFIGSRVSTAIGKTGGAEDASLHEIEFIRHRIGSPGASSQKVLLMGVTWVRQDACITSPALRAADIFEWLNSSELIIGGERNYGFGRLHFISDYSKSNLIFDQRWPEDPETPIMVDSSHPLMSHAPYKKNLNFLGEIEIVAGREYGRDGKTAPFQGPGMQVTNAGYFFAPGTHLNAIRNGSGIAAQLKFDGQMAWNKS
jgi:hypothetical protein